MKLQSIPATDTQSQCINLFTDHGNKFASVNKAGEIRVYGEDAYITTSEAKVMLDISDNFELYFSNIKNE